MQTFNVEWNNGKITAALIQGLIIQHMQDCGVPLLGHKIEVTEVEDEGR